MLLECLINTEVPFDSLSVAEGHTEEFIGGAVKCRRLFDAP